MPEDWSHIQQHSLLTINGPLIPDVYLIAFFEFYRARIGLLFAFSRSNNLLKKMDDSIERSQERTPVPVAS
jgi:hypothetical protein